MNEHNLTPNVGNMGFIPLSRHAYKLLTRKYGKNPASETEAFCILMANVNYQDGCITYLDKTITSPCGESIMSLDTWAQLFRWNKSHVRRYFLVLQRMQLIEYNTLHNLAHIRIVEFLPRHPKTPNNQREEEFQRFWNAYHDATSMPKQSIGRARREWERLTPQERRLAIERIDDYYQGLTNTRYCKQAASYLADKCFLDEPGE